jgi:hypothetical protein
MIENKGEKVGGKQSTTQENRTEERDTIRAVQPKRIHPDTKDEDQGEE